MKWVEKLRYERGGNELVYYEGEDGDIYHSKVVIIDHDRDPRYNKSLREFDAPPSLDGPPSKRRKLDQERVHHDFQQRFLYFHEFQRGIQYDAVGLYSITPESIAQRIAERMVLTCNGHLVIDAFCGLGGNTIQFALYFDHVIAIDIDPDRIAMAKHNARVYGVDHKIDFIVGDALSLLPHLPCDAVFLSPPWGGPSYKDSPSFLLSDMHPNGWDILEKSLWSTMNIAYYLPKHMDVDDIGRMQAILSSVYPSYPHITIESYYINQRLKAITGYMGQLSIPR